MAGQAESQGSVTVVGDNGQTAPVTPPTAAETVRVAPPRCLTKLILVFLHRRCLPPPRAQRSANSCEMQPKNPSLARSAKEKPKSKPIPPSSSSLPCAYLTERLVGWCSLQGRILSMPRSLSKRTMEELMQTAMSGAMRGRRSMTM